MEHQADTDPSPSRDLGPSDGLAPLPIAKLVGWGVPLLLGGGLVLLLEILGQVARVASGALEYGTTSLTGGGVVVLAAGAAAVVGVGNLAVAAYRWAERSDQAVGARAPEPQQSPTTAATSGSGLG